jgi:general nucleoside transport system ATP-binding protein
MPASGTNSKDQFIVEFRNVSKAFGSCLANDNLNFEIKAGTVHALVGENGAGKSTAMNLLFGLFPLSSGEIFLSGTSFAPQGPPEAVASGIAMVHQHFMLNNEETALDNFVLSQESVRKRSLFHLCFPISKHTHRKKLNEMSQSIFGTYFPTP